MRIEKQLKELQAQIDADQAIIATQTAWMKTIQAQLEDLTRRLHRDLK
jgi:hypothetical protein